MQDSLARLRELGFRVLQVADAKTSFGIRSPTLENRNATSSATLSSPLNIGLSAAGPTSPITLPAAITGSDIDALANIWARQNTPLELPTCLVDLYKQSQSNGFFFSVAVLRGAMSGNKAGETAVVCCCRLHPIQLISPVTIDSASIDRFQAGRTMPRDMLLQSDDVFFALSLAAVPTGSSEGAAAASSAGSAGLSIAELTVDLGKGTVCDVLIRFPARMRSGEDDGGDVVSSGGGDVWGRYNGDLFFIAHRVEDYLRLGAIFHWVCGWQLCYAPCGPMPSSVPWMRLLSPTALASALAAPS